jgi:hypothetical protein
MSCDRRTFVTTTALACAAGLRSDSRMMASEETSGRGAPAPQISASIRFLGAYLLAADIANKYQTGYVLLPSGKRGSLKEHRPLLKINRFFVAQPANCKQDPIDPSICVWSLEDTVMKIVKTGGATGLEPAPPAGTSCPVDEAQWRDLAWLADLRKLVPSELHARVKAAEVSNPIYDTKSATRVVLSDGVLGCLLPTVPYVRFGRFKFNDDSGMSASTYKQPLADMLELRTHAADTLKIELTHNPSLGVSTTTMIELTAPPQFTDRIPIVVEHLIVPGKAPHQTHFKSLYAVVTTPPSGAAALFPKEIELCDESRAVCKTRSGDDPPELCSNSDFPVYCPPAQAPL